MRTSRKARLTRSGYQALPSDDTSTVERVLEHPRGQDVLEACDGDAEHALRILEELARRREARGELADVIRLPREPILSFEDVLDDELEEEEEAPPLGLAAWTWLGLATVAGVGLAVWVVLAAIGYGLFRLVGWLS